MYSTPYLSWIITSVWYLSLTSPQMFRFSFNFCILGLRALLSHIYLAHKLLPHFRVLRIRQIVIAIKLDPENTTLLDSYIQVQKNSEKFNFNAINLEINPWKNTNNRGQELPEKDKCHYQIYISIKINIHRVVKNKYNLVHEDMRPSICNPLEY